MKRKTKKSSVTNQNIQTAAAKSSKSSGRPLAKSQTVEAVPISQAKQIAFILVFCLFFLLIFVGVEVTMRMAGYGIDTRLFVTPKYISDMYVDNLRAADKFFPKQSQLTDEKLSDDSIRNYFPVKKPENTLRGFFIGESSVQGYPYQSNHSFSKITQEALKSGGKYQNVEIINLGVSAMTSYYIRDAALKALKYDPDFILIYAGHNEYYGNVSYTTGGNYFSKNLYLALKELRSFQWLFNVMGTDNRGGKTGTLMEKQFNNHHIPSDPKVDREVAGDFIKNINTIVKTYAGKNIPVIIVEPICNIYDMPPFGGENDKEFKGFIRQYYETILGSDREKLQQFYTKRLGEKKYDRNANIRYLDAVTRRILDGKPSRAAFTAAKDLDTVPFRVRTPLVKALRSYCAETAKTDKRLYFIPLADLMAHKYGDGIFGNEIFIDQLHFNQRGQRILANIFSAKIADIFGYSQTEKTQIDTFFGDDDQVSQAIHFMPAYQIAVDKQIAGLTSAPPFTSMLIRYHPSLDSQFNPITDIDKGLVQLTKAMFVHNGNLNIQVGPIVNYYLHYHDPLTAKEYVDADMQLFPGSYWTYLMAARFSLLERNIPQAYEYYKTAYLLSEKKLEIYDEIRDEFYKRNQGDLFKRIVRKYGKPESESE